MQTRHITIAAAMAALLPLAAPPLPAQGAGQAAPTYALELRATRSELERAALRAESTALAPDVDGRTRLRQQTEAAVIRERLEAGDFRVGDRVLLALTGVVAFDDTLVVRDGQTIQIATLPEISLRGVLRSELNEHLTREIGRYIRNPRVRATSLVRLAILGGVNRPGFYDFPAEMLLSETIMRAGGPSQLARLDKVTIRRGAADVLAPGDATLAVKGPYTVASLGLLSGDEITIGEKSTGRKWTTMLQAVGVVMSVTLAAISLSR